MVDTGDRGHWGPSGLLFVDGRSDDLIISGGENIYPSTVEKAILSLYQVDEVAVFGVPDAEFGQRPAAWVVMRKGESSDVELIKRSVRDQAARFCVPRDVHFVDKLPRNAAGKIVRRLLPGV
jgi:acyl-CoA synthetase (AMP-forming)/AMP-acid ligase II